jgi:hypothetical protein
MQLLHSPIFLSDQLFSDIPPMSTNSDRTTLLQNPLFLCKNYSSNVTCNHTVSELIARCAGLVG